MPSINDYYSAEDIVESLLRKELIGPVEEHEILSEPPLEVYSMGILWPQKTTADKTKIYEGIDDAALDELMMEQAEANVDIDSVQNLDDPLDNTDGQISAANVYRPSVMALTTVVSGREKSLIVRFNCAAYLHQEETVFYEKKTMDKNGIETAETKKKLVHNYIRQSIDSGETLFDLKTKRILGCSNLREDIEVDLFVRKVYPDGSRLVTVSAKNKAKAQNMEVLQNTSALFQCCLSVASKEGFLPMLESQYSGNDIETQTLNMLYRDEKNFATGHGCSVKYQVENDKVYIIESEFMPIAEVQQMEPRNTSNYQCFRMDYWRRDVRACGCNELNDFIVLYKKWYFEQKQKSEEIMGYPTAIRDSLGNIELCISRLEQGVRCIRANDTAWEAFLLMNESMLLQRVNYAKTKKKEVAPASVTWYPFQLMYILQNISDFVNTERSWRNVVDLLWFPTGGGKTEAYLGLCAFVIFFRRLTKGRDGDGVSIIMRYTLRLLTAQQFERASALLVACEYLRRKYHIPGTEISIGLWVGLDLTPNTLDSAKKGLEKIKVGELVHKENPVQIFHCPFCGSDIDVGNYTVETTLKIRCPNKNCPFSDGLPIYIVDEDIYVKRPTLLLSTIDKFARIVWEDKTVSLFGSDGNTAPPDLIIQDELHLISGPLGSIDGLYEAAIDELCTRDNVKPKIIASTATIRNVKGQIKALYDRESFQFPPSGIDITDSFFAVRADRMNQPARRYFGICETGGSMLDVLIRVYGCMFFILSYLVKRGFEREIVDQYFTVVGYFNSLKDLGSSATVIIDRVGLYSNSLRLHKFKKIADEVGLTEVDIHFYNELTSRKSSKEIKDALEELEIEYPDERAYSYVLASNMLSVGVDISRLGVMVVYGQPKTNSEYIQATSRVGRRNPGMVMCLYNAMRSRDKSHYEQFTHYHRTLYKHVEPTSVTPFSYRAIEKALHTVYVALIRHTVPELRGNTDAKNYRKNNPTVKQIKQYILERIDSINSESLEYATAWLEDFESLWEKAAKQKEGDFFYTLKNYMPETTYTLLTEAEKDNLSELPSTLNSLRNVDASSNVYIVVRQDEE